MLLIFDIDDTLIDTSGSIVPQLLKNALTVLQARGVPLGEFETAYKRLRHIDSVSISSEEALLEFVELHNGKKRDFEEALVEIYTPSKLPSSIYPVEGVLSLLPDIVKEHTLCIVSRGNELLQKEKLKIAGIPIGFFEDIYISEAPNKKKAYSQILQKRGISPDKIFVIGDRISRDLTPAKELGMNTVHIKWGRGLGYTGIKTDVDYTITSLEELRTILEEPSKEGYAHV